ncbi:MAG: phenylalanine--tRNA ligase subunit alpha [Candidatus Methanofastidiosia archaeon]
MEEVDSILATLSNDEKTVLKKLRKQKGNKARVRDIADSSLPEVAINRAVLGLQSRNLVTVEDRTKKKLLITKDGKKLAESVPERQVCEQILKTGKKEAYLEDLDIDKQLSGIALGWLKKRGWADITKENGKLKIALDVKAVSEMGKPSWIKELLLSIKESGVYAEELPQDKLEILKGRKAVEVKEEKERFLELTELGKEISSFKLETKIEVSQLTPELLRNGRWKECEFKKFDVSLSVKRIHGGKKQPYLAFLDDLKTKLVTLGFKEMRGPLIETEFWNFDALFQPQNHPARDWTDTYRLIRPKKGNLPDEKTVLAVKQSHESSWHYNWNVDKASNLMPRAHGTCLSARQLKLGVDIPGKYFSVARCFRPDVLDKTHLIEFNQIEGIICDPSLTFRNLLGTLKQFAVEIAGTEEVRFYPDYYPFTEPSVQMSARHSELGWVEFGGAGIFREELTKPFDVDIPVIAWGLGVDRLAMFKLGIDDIRFLFSDDLKWLRDEVVV